MGSFSYHTVRYAVVSGAGDVIAAKANFKFRVCAVTVTGASQFTRGAGATPVTGAAMANNINSTDQRDGLFETGYGEKLSHVGAGVGYIAYVEVRDR